MGDQSRMRGYGGANDVAARLRSATADELAALIERYADDPRSGVQKAVEQARKRLATSKALLDETRAKYELMRKLGGEGVVLGVDEVGRGAVAGPLTVACVLLPEDPMVVGLDDSKKLTPQRRGELARRIRDVALCVGISHCAAQDIDKLGMAKALRRTMADAIAEAGVEPDAVLIDGNPVHVHPREICVVKGDAKVACIAAASIVAKVARDALMVEADVRFAGYGLARNKGYASADHIEAIRELGLSEFHRASFCQGFLMEQGSLF